LRNISFKITISEGWSCCRTAQSGEICEYGGGGGFIYNITANGRDIRLDSEISLTTIRYLPEKYNSIRNFWSSIIRKQAEVVILKKEIQAGS